MPTTSEINAERKELNRTRRAAAGDPVIVCYAEKLRSLWKHYIEGDRRPELMRTILSQRAELDAYLAAKR